MMKAANKWVQIQEQEKKGGFLVSESSLVEGIVVSVGQEVKEFKKGNKVLFPAVHGKTMEHSLKGMKYFFVDKDIILAYE